MFPASLFRAIFCSLPLSPPVSFITQPTAAICDAMTLVKVPVNKTLCEKVEGIYYIESGELQRDGSAISTGTLFGVDSLFGANSSDVSKITASQTSESSSDVAVYHIHRQLFQAVLINQTKKSDSKRSKILASIPMLAPLSTAQQRKVASVMNKVKFKKGEIIIKQGEIGNTMYFIEQGNVAIYQTNRGEAEKGEVNRHGAGGFFGEGALVNEGNNGGVRNADCVADATTICYSLERNDFQRLLGSMHELIAIKSKARILKNVQTFR